MRKDYTDFLKTIYLGKAYYVLHGKIIFFKAKNLHVTSFVIQPMRQWVSKRDFHYLDLQSDTMLDRSLAKADDTTEQRRKS